MRCILITARLIRRFTSEDDELIGYASMDQRWIDAHYERLTRIDTRYKYTVD